MARPSDDGDDADAADHGGADDGSPKDRFLTVYGHRPVLAALDDDTLTVDKVLIAEGAGGPNARAIVAAARERGIPVTRVAAQRIKLLAGNSRHDDGVLADVVAPGMHRSRPRWRCPTGSGRARCSCSTGSARRPTWG